MKVASTGEELAIYGDISRLGQSLWAKSLEISGLNTDPKMLSIMLFKRLWSHHRGYTVLRNSNFDLESDIILRSSIEAAICIAANYQLKGAFVLLMRQDAAFTLQSQIKLHRDEGAVDLVKESEAMLRQLQASLPTGTKAAKLEWGFLAKSGRVQQLYNFHKTLSGASSHVTGLSVLRGVVSHDGDGQEDQEELLSLNRKMHLMMMAGAALQGSMLHAGMIEDETHVLAANELMTRLNALSTSWPGAGD